MDQKELDIQRALGTLNIYWIEMSFPYMEETILNLVYQKHSYLFCKL